MIVFVLLLAAFGPLASLGQSTPAAPPTAPTQPPFKRFPTLPPLELVTTDDKPLTKADLKKQNTLIMYFSPSCDHCIAEMKEIKKRMEAFKNIQVIMATYQPMEELKDFVKEYDLEKYSNFRIGRDEKFMLPPFYAMKSLPYLALYNKKGNLITTFEGTTRIEKVLEAFKKS